MSSFGNCIQMGNFFFSGWGVCRDILGINSGIKKDLSV